MRKKLRAIFALTLALSFGGIVSAQETNSNAQKTANENQANASKLSKAGRVVRTRRKTRLRRAPLKPKTVQESSKIP
jgi:hypothetical protein